LDWSEKACEEDASAAFIIRLAFCWIQAKRSESLYGSQSEYLMSLTPDP